MCRRCVVGGMERRGRCGSGGRGDGGGYKSSGWRGNARSTQPPLAPPSSWLVGAHQLVGAAGDDEVDDVVQLEQRVDFVAARHQADEAAAHARRHLCHRVHDQAVQQDVGAGGLLAALRGGSSEGWVCGSTRQVGRQRASKRVCGDSMCAKVGGPTADNSGAMQPTDHTHLEQQTVAAADCQRSNLGQGVGARLKDDEQHTDGRGDLRRRRRWWRWGEGVLVVAGSSAHRRRYNSLRTCHFHYRSSSHE